MALLGACKRKPEPQPAPVASASPRPVPFGIAADRLVDVPAPVASARPKRIGAPAGFDASAYLSVGPMAIDSNGDVYVLDGDLGEVVVEPWAPNAEARLLVRLPTYELGFREELFGIAVDASDVYFSSDMRSSDGRICAFAVRSVSKQGGVARVLARGDAPGGLTTTLAVDDGHVYALRYVNEALDAGGIALVGAVARLPKTGGTLQPVASGLGAFFAFELDGDSIDYFEPRGEGGPIRRVAKSGGAPTTLTTTTGAVVGLAVGASHLYYTERDVDKGTLRLSRIPSAGGRAELLTEFSGFGEPLVVDGGAVHWTEEVAKGTLGPLRVMARSETGGEAREVMSDLPRGVFWTLRNGVVYWGTETGVASRSIR
jgi:hypothetical protein